MCSLVYFLLNTVKLTHETLPSATLDSAVTLGHHGAKNFLMRDGKDVLQCVFYENVSWIKTKSILLILGINLMTSTSPDTIEFQRLGFFQIQ